MENNKEPAELPVTNQTAPADDAAPPPYTPRAPIPPQIAPTVASSTAISAPPTHTAPPPVAPAFLGNNPRNIICPSCQHHIVTTVVYENSNKTHLLAGFVCGVTLWCMLCCLAVLPYYMKYFKKAEHYCPNCNYYIGGYSKC